MDAIPDLSHKNDPSPGHCPDIALERLFEKHRFQAWPKFFKVIFFFPFLLVLLLLRLVAVNIGILILFLLPRTSPKRNAILKALCRISGLNIEVDAKHIDDPANILVANHLSILDRIIINSLIPCSTVATDYRVTTVNSLSFWKDSDVKYSKDITDDEIWTLQRSIEDSPVPLLHFPEGATTNSKVGLLKFQPGVFSINVPVQPILIQVSFPYFVGASPSVLGGAVWTDVFWSLILPCTQYNLRTMPRMEKLPNESGEDFSVRVQAAMASALNLVATNHTSTDKIELLKLLKASKSSGTSSSVSKTRMTEKMPLGSQSSSSPSWEKLSLNTAASTFGKTPKERMASYRDRRDMLLEAAREKYLQKHSS